MEKNLAVSILLDFYKEFLTDKQADTIELYYNQDLSLSEISEHLHITRQGVRDSIKRGEKLLFELEAKLGLEKKFHLIRDKIYLIEETVQEMDEINNKTLFSPELKDKIRTITEALDDIKNK